MQNVCNICPQGSLVTEGCILIGKKSWKYPDVHKQECSNMFLWMVFMHCFMFVFIYLHIVFLSRCGLENISGCSLCKLSGWVNICFKIFLQLHCVPVATGSFHFPSVFHIFCQILVLLGLKLQNTLKNGGLGGEGGGREGSKRTNLSPIRISQLKKLQSWLFLLWCTCGFIQSDISCWLLHKCTHSSEPIIRTQSRQ